MDWIRENWPDIAIPVAVFLAWIPASYWARRAVFRSFTRWAERTRWRGDDIILRCARTPFLLWCILLGAYVSLRVSHLSGDQVALAGKVVASLFVLSLTLAAAAAGDQLVKLYLPSARGLPLPPHVAGLASRGVVLVLGVLVLLDIWGAPVTAIVLLLAAAGAVLAVASRDALPNFLASFQVAHGGQIKVGDYIKLESGEEGYVQGVTWGHTELHALDGSRTLVPNNKLARHTVTNYGRPLKKATEPFRFYSRLHLKELTGLKARDLRELVDTLKQIPDSVVFYHTHRFLEEHHYLVPEPASDFAVWVRDVLGEEALGEMLASTDTLDFASLGALRARLVAILEEHLASGRDSRTAPEGLEFQFVRSVGVVVPTPYVAHDLREFIEVLRKVSTGSLYFHIFEARLRLQKGMNDFSTWMRDHLGEEDLADEIARLNPYTQTLEGLRSGIVQLIEKRIK